MGVIGATVSSRAEFPVRMLNEFDCANLRRKRHRERTMRTMMLKKRTDDERFNEFGLRATLFGSRTSNEMWTRDDVTMAAINCGPGLLMVMKLSAISNAMTAGRCMSAAEPIASKVSSNEIEFRLKSSPTMNATSTAANLTMAMTPNVPLELSMMLIAECDIATVELQFEELSKELSIECLCS